MLLPSTLIDEIAGYIAHVLIEDKDAVVAIGIPFRSSSPPAPESVVRTLPSRFNPPRTFRFPSVASTVIEESEVIVLKSPFVAVIVLKIPSVDVIVENKPVVAYNLSVIVLFANIVEAYTLL